MTKSFSDLTAKSAALYIKMIKEADYENYNNVDGFPLALMDFTSEERGNLADLKKKGLVQTSNDPDTPRYVWVEFVDVEFAYNLKAILKG